MKIPAFIKVLKYYNARLKGKGANSLTMIRLICFFLFSFLIFDLFTANELNMDIYIQRDIQRALGWLQGKFYWPGPEMSAGSNLPGPFFYFLLFPPLMFGEDVFSQSIIWRNIWMALTYTLAFWFSGKIYKHTESLLIFVMFFISCMGTSLFYPLYFAWNAGFSIMFHVLAIITLYYWRETGKHFFLYCLGLIIGFGVQVHFLVSVHLLTVLFIYLFQNKKPLKPVLLFVILTLLPCLPYFIMGFFDFFEISNYSPKNISTYIIKYFHEKWFIHVNEITSFKLYSFGPLLFLFVLIVKKLIKRTLSFQNSTINFLTIIIFPIFIPILPATISWYLYPVPVLFILFFSKLCDDFMPNNQNTILKCLLVYSSLFTLPLFINNGGLEVFHIDITFVTKNHIIICMSLITLICLLVKRIFYSGLLIIIFSFFLFSMLPVHRESPLQPSKNFEYVWADYYVVEPLFKKIILETGWSTKTALKRIYIIGHIVYAEGSLFSYYSLTKENLKKSKEISDQFFAWVEYDKSKKANVYLENPDGYFMIQHLEKFINYNTENWKQFLSNSEFVSDFVRKEILTNKLVIQTPQLYGKFWLIPYKAETTSYFPEGFYNIGQHYYWEEPNWLKNCLITQNYTYNNKFYYCMVLKGHLQRAGFSISFTNRKSNLFMNLNFYGPLLGIKAETSNLDGYAFWSNFKVSLLCNNKKHLYFAPNIGYDPVAVYDLRSKSDTLNTPLKLSIPIHCKKAEEISQIKVIFDHKKKAFHNYSQTKRINQEVTWKTSKRF